VHSDFGNPIISAYAIFAVARDGSWKAARKFSSESQASHLIKLGLYTLFLQSQDEVESRFVSYIYIANLRVYCYIYIRSISAFSASAPPR
jgi:hypothetical protein